VLDPKSQAAFVPNGKSGTLTVIHEDDPSHFRVTQTLPTKRSARTIALSIHYPSPVSASCRVRPAAHRSLPRSSRVVAVSKS
jgi:hypothetical protein